MTLGGTFGFILDNQLGSALVQQSSIVAFEDTLVMWDEMVESPSYPGLTTRYQLHQMTADVSESPLVTFIILLLS